MICMIPAMKKKNPAAVALGELGGKARIKGMTKQEIIESVRHASTMMTPEARIARAKHAVSMRKDRRKNKKIDN